MLASLDQCSLDLARARFGASWNVDRKQSLDYGATCIAVIGAGPSRVADLKLGHDAHPDQGVIDAGVKTASTSVRSRRERAELSSNHRAGVTPTLWP